MTTGRGIRIYHGSLCVINGGTAVWCVYEALHPGERPPQSNAWVFGLCALLNLFVLLVNLNIVPGFRRHPPVWG